MGYLVVAGEKIQFRQDTSRNIQYIPYQAWLTDSIEIIQFEFAAGRYWLQLTVKVRSTRPRETRHTGAGSERISVLTGDDVGEWRAKRKV